MDGIDAALVDISSNGLVLKNHLHLPYPPKLLEQLRRISVPGDNEIECMGQADIDVANAMAQVTLQLLTASGYSPEHICAIGSHGQTIRHRPTQHGNTQNSTGFTLQIGDPNTLATKSGISVVADFRRKDMALGGQGAPLAPGFHLAALNDPKLNQVVLNLGGIANITFLPKGAGMGSESIIGFDTGPANTLIDAWFQQHHAGDFDCDGKWARSGQVDTTLLNQLLSDPYFAAPAPKSTGREYFSMSWLNTSLHRFANLSPEDVQATLTELTIATISKQIRQIPEVDCIHVCGGGVFNRCIMDGIKRSFPNIMVDSTITRGVDPMHIEAMAFAWLAYRRVHNLTGNLPSVTGASKSAVLGSIYLPN